MKSIAERRTINYSDSEVENKVTFPRNLKRANMAGH